MPRARSRHRSTIAVDPLLRVFFDLPPTLPVPPKSGNKQHITGSRPSLPRGSASASSSRQSSPLSKTLSQDDDGVGSDNSLLLGESISLTGDDFYDASYHSPPEGGYVRNHYFNGVSTVPPASLKVDTTFEGDDIMNNLSRKKKRNSAFKSLKKLVGYKGSGKSKLSGASRNSLTSSQLSEDDTVTSNAMGGGSLANEIQRLDETIPVLHSKISMIRSNIQSLERNLLVTRSDLARAHEHLHSATLELESLQRASIEAEIGLSNLCQRQGKIPYFFSDGDVTRSTRSMSSERLHFLTPTSSLVDGDDSDICYTPRSTASFESMSSQTEKDIAQPVLNESNSARVDVDATPLTKNTISKRSRTRDLVHISPIAYDSSDTPSATSTMGSPVTSDGVVNTDELNREPKGNRVTFCKPDSFIRTHDLGLLDRTDSGLLLSLHDNELGPVMDALFDRGLQSAMDESDEWVPVRDTEKILAKRSTSSGEVDGPMGAWANAASGNEVLVWSAPCSHEGHGSEYPLVKARGLIPTTASRVVELLLDSSRVKQYNKMSLGRTDEHYFSKGVDKPVRCLNTGIQGEAKIVRSKSQPPIIRKPVELRILLHARRLHADGEPPKYITIGRSVWETAEGKSEASDASATRCEMLLSANLIRDLECDNEGSWCELTTITHAASPGGIPMSIGKRVGLVAAANYIRDIRNVFEKCEV